MESMVEGRGGALGEARDEPGLGTLRLGHRRKPVGLA